jgi:hypothetical protein
MTFSMHSQINHTWTHSREKQELRSLMENESDGKAPEPSQFKTGEKLTENAGI